MISFRYHIVSIVAVFLALAVGVVLGGGPLSGDGDNDSADAASDRSAAVELRAQVADAKLASAFDNAFAATVAPGLVADRLKGRPVTLVVLPGAEDASVTSMTEQITQSGGSIAGTFRVGEGLLDVSNKQLVDELGSQLMDGTSGLKVPENASGYDRMGALIARAVGTSENGGEAVDDAATGILSGLSTADLMSSEGEVTTRGSLVLFVAGDPEGSDEAKQGAGSILAALSRAVDADTDGVVVGGPVASAREGGAVAAIRSDAAALAEVSTVDTLGRTAGSVVTVLALAEQAAGATGHYGAVDASGGAMPGAVVEE